MKKKMVFAGIGCALVVAAVVCGGLVINERRNIQASLSDEADGILAYKDDFAEFLKLDFGEELSDEEKDKLEVGLGKTEELIEKNKSILENKDFCGGKNQENCEDLAEKVKNLEKFYGDVLILKKLLSEELSNEDLEGGREGRSVKISEMCESISELRGKITDFKAKYPENKVLNDSERTKMIEEYGEIEEYADEIEKRYASLEFEEAFGVKEDDLLAVFDVVESLKK